MNGLDSEEYLGSVYGADKVLYSVAVAIDAVREGNSVTYTNPGKVIFGEPTIPIRVNESAASRQHLSVQEWSLRYLLT